MNKFLKEKASNLCQTTDAETLCYVVSVVMLSAYIVGSVLQLLCNSQVCLVVATYVGIASVLSLRHIIGIAFLVVVYEYCLSS